MAAMIIMLPKIIINTPQKAIVISAINFLHGLAFTFHSFGLLMP